MAAWIVVAGLFACTPLGDDAREARFDLDGDGVSGTVDCDDHDPDILEAGSWYPDADADGFGRIGEPVIVCAQPEGYVAVAGDCADGDPAVNPGAPERCNGVDDDCDGSVDETDPDHSLQWYFDDDGDGFGAAVAGVSCEAQGGWVAQGTDCDDADARVNPNAAELCGDGIDNDCDGGTDDAHAVDASSFFADVDGDGFGDAGVVERACSQPQGFVAFSGDCADSDPEVHPLSPERCDGIDNDCNTAIDDADPWLVDAPHWYEDADGDGYGAGVARDVGCDVPAGFSDNALDCVDSDENTHPNATEVCDGRDNDCDGLVDAVDADLDLNTASTWYPDFDRDGFGGYGPVVRSCEQPLFHVSGASDCDDTHPDVWPGAPELCDELDNDCDRIVDEDLPTVWFPDADWDGFGTLAGVPIAQCDPIPGYSAVLADCDDAREDVFPGAVERCDGVDNDCDQLTDDADDSLQATVWYRDADGDGDGTPHVTLKACEQPVGFLLQSGDCDDGRPAVFTGAPELCDDLDNDCDGVFDDEDGDLVGGVAAFVDADADGYGHPGSSLALCRLRPGYRWNSDDCDDGAQTIHPGASEVCNGVDDDCNGLADDADPDVDPAGFVNLYADTDQDGFGTTPEPAACAPAEGTAAFAGDCNDASIEVYPGARELCDGVDNDCDGVIDDGTPPLWYRDVDGDGHGVATDTIADCEAPEGYVSTADDCDDQSVEIHPGRAEICDGIDNDCDGVLDGADTDLTGSAWYADLDGDGFGDDDAMQQACARPGNYVEVGGDCNDASNTVHPGATERCGGLDEDCDGLLDDADPDLVSPTTWYPDADRDGFGDPAAGVQACTRPQGYVADATDCDDLSAKIHLGAPELCGGADDDCDGLVDDADPSLTGAPHWYADADGDGFGNVAQGTRACEAPAATVADGGDCSDGDASIHPAAFEVAGNEVDENCDGNVDCFVDSDQDGYGSTSTVTDDGDGECSGVGEAELSDDCDDGDDAVHPGATEVCGGGDEDCDGLVDTADPDIPGTSTWYEDADGDGYGAPESQSYACERPSTHVAVAGDCDDSDDAVHPGAAEVCGGADEDCDGLTDDADPSVSGATAWYVDDDSDGYGSGHSSQLACVGPAGWVALATDCDDSSDAIHPGATEVPGNEVDEDCDQTWLCYVDDDGDTYGIDTTVADDGDQLCTGQGEATRIGDCNDADDGVHPQAAEVCGGGDEDCDALVDDDDPNLTAAPSWYRDADDDGYGTPLDGVASCASPAGYVVSDTDCDDSEQGVNPGADEVPGNAVDEDCTGVIACYQDADFDGFGATSATVVADGGDGACLAADGESDWATDCDDLDSAVHPGATETPGNQLDEDCDARVLCYVDADQDGYGVESTTLAADTSCLTTRGESVWADDCNDESTAQHPGATDVSGNAIDEDCDGLLLCDVIASPETYTYAGASCPSLIDAIRDPTHPWHPSIGSQVELKDLVVTATNHVGFSVQDPRLTVFAAVSVNTNNTPSVAEGDVVTVWGTYDEYEGMSAIMSPGYAVTGTTSPLAATVVVDPCSVATGGGDAERYESMLVQVGPVVVSDSNPDAPDDFGEWEVEDCLRIDDWVCSDCWGSQPDVGTGYSAITGPLVYTNNNFKLVPRRPADLEP